MKDLWSRVCLWLTSCATILGSPELIWAASRESAAAARFSFNGETVRSCLLLAVQVNGGEVLTVEGLAGLAKDGEPLHPIQQGFLEKLGFQCGFCTPGFLMTVYELLSENPSPSESEIREHLSGNLCRCTGYQNIVAAVLWAAERLQKTS